MLGVSWIRRRVWSLAILAGGSLLDLDTIIRTHGVLNAIAMLAAVGAYRSPDA